MSVTARATPAVPADPGLPGLGTLGDWASAVVLAHRPGRRMTLRVAAGDGPARREHILKLFCPAEFDAAARGARLADTLTGGRLREPHVTGDAEGLAPALLAQDPSTCSLHLELLDAPALDAVTGGRRGRAVADLGRGLAALHRSTVCDPPPPWDARHPGTKLLRWFGQAVAVDETCAGVHGDVAALAARLDAATSAAVLVHGDVSLRNVVAGPTRARLIDWDRAALGPPEVDLAPLVGLLGDVAEPLLAGYRAAGGEVDPALLADLVLANRLTRVLRRRARRDDPSDVTSAALAALVGPGVER